MTSHAVEAVVKHTASSPVNQHSLLGRNWAYSSHVHPFLCGNSIPGNVLHGLTSTEKYQVCTQKMMSTRLLCPTCYSIAAVKIFKNREYEDYIITFEDPYDMCK